MSSWKSILSGASAERAGEVVDEIAAQTREPDGSRGPGLPGGAAGLALFHGYLHQLFPGRDHDAAGETLLEAAIEGIASQPTSTALHGGFPGVGWAVEHLVGSDEDDFNEDIDEAVALALDREPTPGAYDLIGGLVGLGVYALERGDRGRGPALVTRVVELLDALAERDGDRITWFTPAGELPPWQREHCPDGYYNLGVAHGVPAVIAFCGHAAGRGHAAARRLADGAVRWLASVTLPEERDGCLPAWLCGRPDLTPARVAWCYGDLGAAGAVLAAAERAGEPAWREVGLMLARAAARRPPDRAGVRDAGICHGSAGVAHVFNRIWQATGDPEMERAARFWLDRTLELRDDRGSLAGYRFYHPRDDGDPWVSDAGLLTGAAGVALVLAAAIGDVEPIWDRCLLVDVPVRTADRR